MDTSHTITRAQLRSLCNDQAASPQSRLSAANTLINTFGLTARNLRVARRTAKLFAKHVASSPRSQQQIRWQSEKLLARIERALENGTEQPDDAIDENDENGALEEHATKPKSIIGNIDLLPSDDDDDPFWSEAIGGESASGIVL